MSIHTGIQRWTLGALVAIALAGPVSSIPPAAGSVAQIPKAFVWPGVFDIVGTGFPDGERRAVMHIAQTDTSYALVSLQGPPGALMRFHVSGDSAHVVWNLGDDVMAVDLCGSGDSLTGEWTSGDWRGPIRGVRRR